MSRVWRTWAVLVLFAIGTSMITPLIPIYQDRLAFGDTVVTLFLGCYVLTLVPSMLSLGQLSDRIGRKRVLLGGIAVLAARPGRADHRATALGACWSHVASRAWPPAPSSVPARRSWWMPPRRDGAASPPRSDRSPSASGSGSARASAASSPSTPPTRCDPFEVHLVALAVATVAGRHPARDRPHRSRRPLTLRLEVPAAERAVFWRVLVPSGMLFSLFDGIALSLVPVFVVRKLEIDNYAVVGAAGFLVLVSGAVSQCCCRGWTRAGRSDGGLAAAVGRLAGVVPPPRSIGARCSWPPSR